MPMAIKEVVMIFTGMTGQVGDTSYYGFTFEQHDLNDVCCGDQIWSDGTSVEISEDIDSENLDYLISLVSNRTAFKGALRRVGLKV